MTRILPLLTWRSAIVDSDLTPSERLVALVLSLHMSERGDSCWPSVDTIAAEAGLNYETVRKLTRSLEQKGWLRKTVQRRGGHRGTRVVYEAVVVIHRHENGTGLLETCTDLNRSPQQDRTGLQDRIEPVSTRPVIENSSMNSPKNSSSRVSSATGCPSSCPRCEGSNHYRPHPDDAFVIPCPRAR